MGGIVLFWALVSFSPFDEPYRDKWTHAGVAGVSTGLSYAACRSILGPSERFNCMVGAMALVSLAGLTKELTDHELSFPDLVANEFGVFLMVPVIVVDW